jgi:hypothetical protein
MYVSAYYYIRVLILLCACPHTTIYVSSYYFIHVRILTDPTILSVVTEQVRQALAVTRRCRISP